MKFFVVAYLHPRLRYFLINSQPSAFQAARPHLLDHQVRLQPVNQPFLKHESVLDCTQVIGGPTLSELEDSYSADPSILIGQLSAVARAEAKRIFAGSKVLPGREKETLLTLW